MLQGRGGQALSAPGHIFPGDTGHLAKPQLPWLHNPFSSSLQAGWHSELPPERHTEVTHPSCAIHRRLSVPPLVNCWYPQQYAECYSQKLKEGLDAGLLVGSRATQHIENRSLDGNVKLHKHLCKQKSNNSGKQKLLHALRKNLSMKEVFNLCQSNHLLDVSNCN